MTTAVETTAVMRTEVEAAVAAKRMTTTLPTLNQTRNKHNFR